MRLRLLAAMVPIALVVGCGGSGGSTASLPVAELDKEIVRLMNEGLAGGSMVYVSTPAGTWSKAYGLSNLATNEKMSLDMHYRIGSNTKPVVCTAVLQLVEDGLVELDEPISTYLDGVPNGDKVTVRMLGSMTSGIPSYTQNDAFVNKLLADPKQPWTPAELLTYAYALPERFAPGTNTHYSNTNTVILGLLVEKMRGKPLHDVIQERILDPLTLAGTRFPVAAELPTPFTHGYTRQTPTGAPADAFDWNPSWGWAAGAMTSTIADMARWAPILATGNGILKPETQTERLKYLPVGANAPERHYQFGMYEMNGWRGHNGSLPGYNNYVMHNPRLNATVVVMVNTDNDWNSTPPATVLLDRITAILYPGEGTGASRLASSDPW